MKNILLVIIALAMISCNNDVKKKNIEESKKEEFQEQYPKELVKIFEVHGGVKTWKKAKTLSFNKGEEVHTVDLQSRKTVIHHPNYSLGFDGNEVWLSQEKEDSYKGNPTFYYNLYFYFYAMPFVLADDGITYENVEAITFNEVTYPGIKISYEAHVGTSPDDNYILYYHPETYQMQWLAYTVTFTSKEPSDKYNLIKYDTWKNTNGFILPKTLIWYKKDENGNPTEPAGRPTEFTLPLVSESKLADSFFEKPKE